MKTRVWITFRAEKIPGEADAILIPTGCGPDVAKVSDYTILNIRDITVDIKLDETDERVAKVFALLEHYGVEADTSTYDEYSEEDRQNARLLWVGPLDWFDEVYAGLPLGTEYDLTQACPNCKTGAKQTSPLYVAQKDIAKIRKHRATRTMDGDIIGDWGLVKKPKATKVTGTALGDVRARHENGKWSEVARDQILIEHMMPPMRGELTARDEQYLCKVCRRGGRMVTPPKPYREEDLIGMKDFNLTWEWFGEFWPAIKEHPIREKRRDEKRPHPSVLVTPRVMNIFREAGVKTFDWIPVGIEQ